MSKARQPIPDYEGLYEITDTGQVYSLVSGKCLKPRVAGLGYYTVMLYKNKYGKSFYIHRLVAGSFLPLKEGKTCVNHKDGDKTNNCTKNLEWVTHSENMYHANRTGLHNGSNKQKDAARKNGKVMRKLTSHQAEKVREMYSDGMLQRAIGDFFGITQGQVSRIILGKSYKEAAQ